MQVFEVLYTDAQGVIQTVISLKDALFRIVLEQTVFRSHSLDDFEPIEKENLDERFHLDSYGYLTDCQLALEIPCLLSDAQKAIYSYPLRVFLIYEATQTHLVLELSTPLFSSIRSQSTDLFELAFLDLQKQLPEGYAFHNCFGCAFSDYSVYGQGLWGSMLCYKNIKSEYQSVKNKDEFMEIMDNFDGIVAETHHCEAFEARKPNTGYRG